jgi:hypothetical protein
MEEAERAPVTAHGTPRRPRRTAPVIATALGVLVLVLAVALVPLAILRLYDIDRSAPPTPRRAALA